MAVSYTNVDRMILEFPMINSMSTVSSAQLAAFIENSESHINGILANNYTIPVTGSGVPPILTTIATDLAIYRVLRRIFTKERLKDSDWPGTYKETTELLNKIAEGGIPIVNPDGSVVEASTAEAQVLSNNRNYLPTFHEGHEFDHIQDKDKIEDIESDRGLI